MNNAENVTLESIKPIGHRVLIKPDPEKEVYEDSGLIIPETLRKMMLIGTIIATGEGTRSSPMKVKIGDRVIYPRAVKQKTWIIQGETYLFCIQQDLIMREINQK